MSDADQGLVNKGSYSNPTDENYEEGCCSKFATTTGLCCFMSANEYKHNPLAEVVQNDKRRCTDLPCCIILILCLISELVLIIYADVNGASPSLLMHGYDSRVQTLDAQKYTDAQLCDSSNPGGIIIIHT